MTDQPERVTLTGAQLLGAIGLSGRRPGENSPLNGIPKAAEDVGLSGEDEQALRELGWLAPGTPARLSEKAGAALEALCQPAVTCSLLLGMRDSFATTNSYSARGLERGALVSFAAAEGQDSFRLLLGQSPSDLADAMMIQLMPNPAIAVLPFQATLTPIGFLTFLGIMDAYLHSTLQSALDRQPQPEPRVSAGQVWEMIAEGGTTSDWTWQVSLFSYLLPGLSDALEREQVAEALEALRAQGLVSRTDDTRFTLGEALLELCRALLPPVAYAALLVEDKDRAGNETATQITFLRGPSAILMVQPREEEGNRLLFVDCISGVELADILFDLGLPVERAAPAPKTEPAPGRFACPTCGADNSPGRKFCAKCGAPLMPTAEQPAKEQPPGTTQATCPVCKAIVKPGRKFCSACGAPLTVPTDKTGVR